MEKYLFKFEYLPNELIMEIFKYFDAYNLYNAFYNLNYRFNTLLKTAKYLSLNISSKERIQQVNLQVIAPYIYTLIINRSSNVYLTYFIEIRRLSLVNPTAELIGEFDNSVVPYLEYLSMSCESLTYYMPGFIKKNFSNNFPNLRSCHLIGVEPIYTSEGWTQSPSIRILKVGFIDLFIYPAILLACPNLCFLALETSFSTNTFPHNQSYMNLKRLDIRFPFRMWPRNAHVIGIFFACLPNLEQLTVHRLDELSINIQFFLNDDWLASKIASYLSLLRQFTFYLHVFRKNRHFESIPDKILHQLQENFKNAHNNRYQSRLIIDSFDP
ncbi:unnamed protein product [Rotaria sp. Silwood2]|nr:unnamed protein product [Rotaria sp. Silwood2]CAF4226145.1 unnamed protein product [Rotaria sp. Silwood2]CAF4519767.1 unnamed protein product [Rotaria sp. Silwood2]